jgi:hypothetical protein
VIREAVEKVDRWLGGAGGQAGKRREMRAGRGTQGNSRGGLSLDGAERGGVRAEQLEKGEEVRMTAGRGGPPVAPPRKLQ